VRICHSITPLLALFSLTLVFFFFTFPIGLGMRSRARGQAVWRTRVASSQNVRIIMCGSWILDFNCVGFPSTYPELSEHG
jgi:hypothetical protein